MARRIKPYNYSYRVATRFLKDHPKAELGVVYVWTIAHLNSKHNFSKEGVRRAWNDFKKLKSHAANWGMDMRASWPRPTSQVFDDKLMDKLVKEAYGLTGPKIEDHIYDAMIYGISFMKIKL